MTAAAPSGVVTFLFTDVEGSTRRWEADADEMRAALATHDQVLRRAIEAHGGFLFKHTGDGVCAAFASPKRAVDAAVAAQRVLELPVRMGIATGEAELRDGDYFSRLGGVRDWRAALATELGCRAQLRAARPTREARGYQCAAAVPAVVHASIVSPLVRHVCHIAVPSPTTAGRNA